MKKIYILTAVFALLALSLNAQMLKVDQNGKVVPPKAPIEKVTTTPDGYFRMGPSRASTDPVTPPYTNGFTNTTEQNWWQVIDANSDGSTWTISSQRARYHYNYTYAANDWLITAPVYLEVGKTYKFYIDASVGIARYPEKLEVKLALANNETALSNGATVIPETTLNSTTAQTLSNENVTVSQTGNYYFGIHAISDRDMYELYVDNLVIDVEDTNPRVTVSPDQLTISDSGTNNTFNVEAYNIYNGENLGVTPHNGFSTTCTSSTNNVADWGFYQNNGSVNGTVAVNYTGRALTASDDIAVGTLGASTTVHVDYVPNLYIYCDYGASTWDFSANPAVAMTNNGDGTYTAMLNNIPANSHILFGRTTGLTYYWEGDNNRLFFGASTDGGDWGYGDNTSGYLDTEAGDDYPVKYHPIYFSEGGTYTITINANDYTFTITKLVYPAPENVVATADSENQTATVTWDAPSELPSKTVTEGFDDQTVFEPFSIGGITSTNHVGINGGWTLYDPTGATVWGVDGGDFPNMAAPHAWIVMNPSQATGIGILPHSDDQYMESICPLNNSSYTGGASDHWLISPRLSGNAQDITFWERVITNQYGSETYEVLASSNEIDRTDPSSGFSVVQTINSSQLEWTERTISLPAGTKYFAIRHISNDIFGMMVDDVTYEAAIEPESYNIYLDGQLVGSVDADAALTYNFSNLAVGDHECAVSAVYPGGIESEDVPATFNIMARTATPTINVVANADGSKTITATGDGTVHLYVDGVEVTNPYTIMPSPDGDMAYTVTATAQEEGKLISETAEQIVTVAEAGRTPTPVIDVDEQNGYVVITATGDGTVTLTVDGQTVTGEGSASITIVKSLEDQNVTATATAQDGDLIESRPATKDVTIPALNTTPTNPESGLLRLHLLIVDQMKEAIPADNSHPDKYGYVLRYEPNGPQGEGVKESGSVRVDIQKADCEVMGAYTLTEVDNDKNIGAYDPDSQTIKHNLGMTMNAISADVEYDLSSDNDILYAYLLQGAENRVPGYQADILTELQKTQNFTYVEMEESNPNKGTEYPNGEHHFFVGEENLKTGAYGSSYMSYAPSVSTWGISRRYYEDDGYDNTYGAPIWKTGAGEVEMKGTPTAELQTGKDGSTNWEYEGQACSLYILDNIEAVGKLPHSEVATVEYEPYMFRVFVESKNGLLRHFQKVDGDGVNTGEHYEGIAGDPYGPICVWSGYVADAETPGLGQTFTPGATSSSSDAQPTLTFKKVKVDRTNADGEWDQDETNAIFGAVDALAIAGYDDNHNPIYNQITSDDLNIFVRFYYVVAGSADDHEVHSGRRDGDSSRPGNGSESPGKSPDPQTAVKEINYNGEVVSVTYVNSLGMQSEQPFDGVNIVVTRYSDGKIRTTKVVR